MGDEFLQVVSNLGVFAEGLQTSGANAKVVMMNLFGLLVDPVRDSQFGMDPNRYKYLPVNVDSWNALRVLLDQYDNYKSFLRPGAPKHFVVVSDDESSMAADQFKTQMEAKLGGPFFFHAIVSDGTCLGAFNRGTQYLNLADSTGGEKLPICSSDWTKLFKELESAVLESAPLPCDFEIPEPPAGQSLDENAVQVMFEPVGKAKTEFPKATDSAQCGDKLGWFYNNDRVEFCPSACDLVKTGGSVAIGFGCEPTILF